MTEIPRLALAFKMLDLTQFDTSKPEALREYRIAYCTAIYTILRYTEHPTALEKLRAAYEGRGAPMHCELLMTAPCTMTRTQHCHVPVRHAAGRVEPNHCITITCANGSVYMKETPAHAEPLWTYYPIEATDEELYRLLIFATCMLGSRHRGISRIDHFVCPMPKACVTRIISAYARNQLPLHYLDAAREFADEVERGHAMRAAREEFERANPGATEEERERFVTAEALRRLGEVLPGGSGSMSPIDVARRMTQRVHEFYRGARSVPPEYQAYSHMFPNQPHTFTCIQFACDALAFAGVLQRFRENHADGPRIYPANCLVAPIYNALRADERISASSQFVYSLMVRRPVNRGHVPRQPPPEEPTGAAETSSWTQSVVAAVV